MDGWTDGKMDILSLFRSVGRRGVASIQQEYAEQMDPQLPKQQITFYSD